MQSSNQASDWVTRMADLIAADIRDSRTQEPFTCASGISPSGPIHIGNLREIMVPHLVHDELLRRGLSARHILSWDDYDRFRAVPPGYSAEFAEHVGRPLVAVPDPCGDHENWAEHFKAPFREALDALGVTVVEISQARMYQSGSYQGEILAAMRHRKLISSVLGRDDGGRERRDSPKSAHAAAYYPFRPYCSACGKDGTKVTSYVDRTAEISYECACGHSDGPRKLSTVAGKLAWKVDWPMRWRYERVGFEAAGVDHASPGSSFDVADRLVREVFAWRPPHFLRYSFVGTSGSAKISSSRSVDTPVPLDALEVLEAPIMRWFYMRSPERAITITLDRDIQRVYDEWDALGGRVSRGAGSAQEKLNYLRAVSPSGRSLPLTPTPIAFRALASILDISGGDRSQLLRILGDVTGMANLTSLDQFQPRLDRAAAWLRRFASPEDKTVVLASPDATELNRLSERERVSLDKLLVLLHENWTLERLTRILYGVPKLEAGLDMDAPASKELKAAQRAWFKLLYRLLIGRETGPRLPTLFLAIGRDRVHHLLSGDRERTSTE